METFFTAILSFVSTNLDDIFVLTLLYAQVQDAKGTLQIIAGQYLGIGCLIALSVLGALGTQLFPPQYIGLLGILPLLLGIRAWIVYRSKKDRTEAKVETQISFLGVTMLTIANGADNIGVYIPVFSGAPLPELTITILVFAAMLALWCWLGSILGNYPYIKEKIVRYQHVLVPVVLICLGFAILAKNYIL